MLSDILVKLSGTDFPTSQATSTSRLLFDIQMWLLSKRCLVEVYPIDDWDHWSYRVTSDDLAAPFFEPDYDKFTEFPSYQDALEAGLNTAIDIIQGQNKK